MASAREIRWPAREGKTLPCEPPSRARTAPTLASSALQSPRLDVSPESHETPSASVPLLAAVQRWTVPGEPLHAAFRCLRLHGTLSVRACLLPGGRPARPLEATKPRARVHLPLVRRVPPGRRAGRLDARDQPAEVARRGAGWLGRFERGREGRRREAQELARERLRVVGLLEGVPTCDAGAFPEADGEE